MQVKPIIFSRPMVQAILAGRKSQTRRVIKPQPTYDGTFWSLYGARWGDAVKDVPCAVGHSLETKNPYGRHGDLLYVRENFLYRASKTDVIRHADLPLGEAAGVGAMYGGWKPSIHMPRWASRLTLIITDVRVQRLHDISEEDSIAEGVRKKGDWFYSDASEDFMSASVYSDRALDAFRHIWDNVHGAEAWDKNPWLWCLTFSVVNKNVDEVIASYAS